MPKNQNILIFDNYDSFTYNLVHAIEHITKTTVTVCRNDEWSLEKIDAFDSIILSPGPGIPQEAGLLLPLIKQYASTKKILGVCLGHQAIAEAFGGSLTNLRQVYHGIATPISQTEIISPLFKNLPKQFNVGRYHSWIVNKEDLPTELQITATDEHGFIMAMQHKTYNIQAVQFHPESVLTPLGNDILRNWVQEM
jgi:anthranilate synthase component 2